MFLHDRHNLLEQYDENQLARSVVSHMKQDDVLVSSSSGSDFYLLSDLTGSVRYLFDGADKRNFYIYDEFGSLQDSLIAADDNPFRFAGKRLLGDTSKYDFTYRTYDLAIGKFMQRDPKGFVDGTNLYTFLRSNPLVLTDSLGLESRAEHASLKAKLGAELAYRHPPGFTLKVPNNFDEPKLRAPRERINNPLDRGVGIRGYPSDAGGSRTKDLRQRDASNVAAFRNSLDPQDRATIGRGSGRNAVDHVVELQMIIRSRPGVFAPGADTTRPQDYRLQDFGLNSSQGKSLDIRNMRQIQDGVPFDTPAGGVARESDANKFWNRQSYRTGVRYL
jgi:RHS repeat-associated protein